MDDSADGGDDRPRRSALSDIAESVQMTTSSEQAIPMWQDDAERRKRVRRTTLVVTLVVLAFYFGFIAMMLYRATR